MNASRNADGDRIVERTDKERQVELKLRAEIDTMRNNDEDCEAECTVIFPNGLVEGMRVSTSPGCGAITIAMASEEKEEADLLFIHDPKALRVLRRFIDIALDGRES